MCNIITDINVLFVNNYCKLMESKFATCKYYRFDKYKNKLSVL